MPEKEGLQGESATDLTSQAHNIPRKAWPVAAHALQHLRSIYICLCCHSHLMLLDLAVCCLAVNIAAVQQALPAPTAFPWSLCFPKIHHCLHPKELADYYGQPASSLPHVCATLLLISLHLPAGPGEMFWRLFSAITLLEKRGPEVDQANLSRYLAEACYIPTALLPGQHVSWRAIDSDRAEATLWHAGSKAVAEFHFNEKGQITKMTATDRARCAWHLACLCAVAETLRWGPAAFVAAVAWPRCAELLVIQQICAKHLLGHVHMALVR